MNLNQQITNDLVASDPTFDPISTLTLISAVLSAIVQCWKSQNNQTSLSNYVTDHYDAETDTFEPTIVASTRVQIRQQIRQQGDRPRNYTRDQINAMADTTLRKAMANPVGVNSALMAQFQ